jgi:hypothetical protein
MIAENVVGGHNVSLLNITHIYRTGFKVPGDFRCGELPGGVDFGQGCFRETVKVGSPPHLMALLNFLG